MTIEQDWSKSGFEQPSVLYAINEKSGETYLVIEDNSTIFRVLNKQGNIYVIAGFRCVKKSLSNILNGETYYSCEDIFHPITCSKIDSLKDKFVLELKNKYL